MYHSSVFPLFSPLIVQSHTRDNTSCTMVVHSHHGPILGDRQNNIKEMKNGHI